MTSGGQVLAAPTAGDDDGAMSWWRKLLSRGRGPVEGAARPPASGASTGAPAVAVWREADETPFGVRVLDLIAVTGKVIATSTNPACATRAVSWHRSVGDDLDIAALDAELGVACDLRYPAAERLADGLLFTPRSMDDKWLLALSGDRLIAARSWTGEVKVVARVGRRPGEVTVERLAIADDAGLAAVGDPVAVFDWLVRTLALGQRLPLPVNAAGADTLARTPLVAFSLFGHAALCAARSWQPPPPSSPLRTDGRVLRAVREHDQAELRRLAAAGESLDPPSPIGGLTPLCLAAMRGDVELTRLLLELGADPDARDDRGMFALGYGVVHGAGLEVLQALVDGGSDRAAVNEDGFGLLHAAAEHDRGDVIPWLLACGVALEARTGRGHTPLQIACALGKLAAVEALLAAGADPRATSPDGTAADIAAREEQAAVVARLAQ